MVYIKNLKFKKMKKILSILLVLFSLNLVAQENELEWHTDVTKAINISMETEKPLFFFFYRK